MGDFCSSGLPVGLEPAERIILMHMRREPAGGGQSAERQRNIDWNLHNELADSLNR